MRPPLLALARYSDSPSQVQQAFARFRRRRKPTSFTKNARNRAIAYFFGGGETPLMATATPHSPGKPLSVGIEAVVVAG